MQISRGWPGLPNDIDAAVVWGRNGKGYFFKGLSHHACSPSTQSLKFILDLDEASHIGIAYWQLLLATIIPKALTHKTDEHDLWHVQ